MKLQREERDVNLSVAQSGKFKIEANSKAFKALIDGLYSNKAVSITREIWCNAYDAHVENGCADKPFKITYPSLFNNEFRVRDYGPGLSHEDIMGLYTTVFKSTKEDSNDGNGKWGLGSKSPFAYTDTYSVTSWHKGRKRTYSAVIGRDGVPTINLMGDELSTEPSGLEVCFPVDAGDVRMFADAATEVSLGFDVKPEGLKESRTFNVKVEGKNYKIGSFDFSNQNGGKFYAKMGTVVYPVATGHLTTDSQAVNDIASFLSYGEVVMMDFNIGDLEVNLSREGLSYGKNECTVPNLERRILEISQEILKDTVDSINKAKTLREANSIFDQVHYNKKKFITHTNDFPGRNIYTSTVCDESEKYQGRVGYGHSKWGVCDWLHSMETKWKYELNRPAWYLLDQFKFVTAPSQRTATVAINREYSHHGNHNSGLGKHVFLVDRRLAKNKNSWIPRRIKQYLQINSYYPARIWLYAEVDATNHLIVNKQLATLKKRVGDENVEVVWVHEIPFSAPKSKSGPVKLLHFKTGSIIPIHTTMSPEIFDEGGYYVKSEKGNILPDLEMLKVIPSMEHLGRVKKIVGRGDENWVVVPKTYWSRFEKSPEWKPLSSIWEEMTKTKELQMARRYAAIAQLRTSLNHAIRTTYNPYDWFPAHARLVEPYLEKLDRFYETYKDQFSGTGSSFRTTDVSSIKQLDRILSAIEKEREKKYPLVNKLSGWTDKTLTQYYELVNSKGR